MVTGCVTQEGVSKLARLVQGVLKKASNSLLGSVEIN
jgi:hypothetical protein